MDHCQEEPEIEVTWKVGRNSSNRCGNTSYILRLGTCESNNSETFCNKTLFNTSRADVLLSTQCPHFSNQSLLATIEMESEKPYKNSSFFIHDLEDTRKYCVSLLF